MASTLQKSRKEFVGASFNVPAPRPRTNSLRINWRKFSSSARSVLCIRTTIRAQQDGNGLTRDSKDVLHTRSRSDVPSSSSREGSMALQKSTPRRLLRAHTEKANGNASAKDVAKTPTIRSTDQMPSSETAASLDLLAPLIKERGAQHHRPGDASPFCNLDQASLCQFETTAEHQVGLTGDTIGAVIDAMFQLGDRSDASTPGLLTPYTDDEDSDSEETEEKEGRDYIAAAVEEPEKRISARHYCWEVEVEDAGAAEEARRAWEAMKRRVMYIEEYGAVPDDLEEHETPTWNYRDAVDRALRESRARWRKGWAEEAIRRSQAGQQLGQEVRQSREGEKDANPNEDSEEDSEDEMEMDVTTTMTKKGRRHAGCWIREKDGVFVRLYARRT